MQSSKWLDVKRSFIPVDPNSYPENLHSTDREDSPEQRIPVVPYMGYNFLPTGYGYKSYFGTGSKVAINALANTNKPDHVFVFQTLTYKNVLVALCDTGIWAKDGSTAGNWSQIIALAAPGAGVYAEWTYTIIKNILYCFRSNGTVYYKIETSGSAAGVSLTQVAPTFITLANQLGLFRLGSRLAFWDGANAIAWCNPDDLTDFEPKVITGANVTTFKSIIGKISSVRTHGRHAIVYATKSVVLLEVAPGETFLVKAQPILTGTGVSYLKQSVSSFPDTVHFCITDSGIYKIDSGKPELIVPEVYDFFKGYTAYPIYLRVLQGRYLCFEVLDPRLINGNAQFSRPVIPGASVNFPGSIPTSLEALVVLNPVNVNICDAVSLLTQSPPHYSEITDDANSKVPSNLRKPGTDVQPVYTCYISDANGPVEPIVWTNTPCGAVKPNGGNFTPSPTGNGGKLSLFSSDATNKTEKAGTDVWMDGKWTMQRFVQYQSAIWQSQEKAMAGFIQALLSRYETDSKTEGAASCTPSTTPAECTIGRYPTAFSDYQFGFNKCSFWLTRYALEASDIKNTVTTTVTCADDQQVLTAATHHRTTFDGTVRTSLSDLTTYMNTINFGGTQPYVPYLDLGQGQQLTGGSDHTVGGATYRCFDIAGSPHWKDSSTPPQILGTSGGVQVCVLIPAGYAVSAVESPLPNYPAFPQVTVTRSGTPYLKTTTAISANSEVPVTPLTPTPESAYCVLTGWKYVDVNGITQTMAADSCTVTADKYPGSGEDTGARVVPSDAGRNDQTNDATGDFCGIPFESSDVENDPVEWEDQTIITPDTNFLLQIGSIAPVYPTKYGAFVYDLHLKKWGKMKMEYKQLLDYSPINSTEGSVVNFDVFGILAGVFKVDGSIYFFDNEPSDSSITWGKIGYYRAGFTDAQEVRFDFASVSAGTVTIDISIDGKTVASDLSYSEAFNGVTATVYPPYSGKWYNISLSGKWDVSYLEFKGMQKGRR